MKTMQIRKSNILLTVIFILLFSSFSQAQDNVAPQKSQIIENIDGKDYYLHFVKKGETLFGISKLYNVTVDELFKTNPAAKEGIRPGMVLKIEKRNAGKQSLPETPGQQESGYYYHIVKQGETLYSLSKTYNVSIDDIKNYNPGVGKVLKEGVVLKIPEVKKVENIVMSGKSVHSVKQGETLYGIAKQYNVTIGALKNYNPGLTDNINPGQKLVIPESEDVATVSKQDTITQKNGKFILHKVKSHETLFSIAKNYAVGIDTLKKYNPGLSEYIFVGQEIKIPVKKSSPGYIVHKAESNDKLKKIARRYNVSYSELLRKNPGVSKKVKKGQKVKIPVKGQILLEDDKPAGPVVEKKPETESEPTDLPCGNTIINREKIYNVALMIPLFLNEVDSLSDEHETIPNNFKPFKFIQFYEGFMIAVDSMQKAGMKLNVFTYDVDKNPETINEVLEKSELSSMDIIIGPFYARSFDKVAEFAKTYGIKIVNPLSPREEVVINNPFVFKIKPALTSQTDLLVSFIEKKYPESNVVIVRHNKYKFQSFVSYVRNKLNIDRVLQVGIDNSAIINKLNKMDAGRKLYTENTLIDYEQVKRDKEGITTFSNTVKEVIYSQDSISGLKMNLSLFRENIVVILSEDKAFAQELLARLNKFSKDYDINVVGLPEWDKFNDLDSEPLSNLSVHIFSDSYIDYNDAATVEFIEKFRIKYHTEPSVKKYAFPGFDIGWYFLNALYNYGKSFEECMDSFEFKPIGTKYVFEHKQGNGYENRYWNIFMYDNFSVKKVEVDKNN